MLSKRRFLMSPDQIVREIEEKFEEYLEMSENPDRIVSGILAKKIIRLTEYIEYLEKRLYDDCAK